MYYPILRGRQFELIALRECIENKLISDEIIPVLEPVRFSSTLLSTLKAFTDNGKSIAFIMNPQVGSWKEDIEHGIDKKKKEELKSLLRNSSVFPSYYVTEELLQDDTYYNPIDGLNWKNMILISNDPNQLITYTKVVCDHQPMCTLVPDQGIFRRTIRQNRVLLEDHFVKRDKNADYVGITSEFFSSDHLFYKADGYIGFSDYSIVGSSYSESGFAPYAVVIHIVYFDENKNLQVAHFVSDSNEDIKDVAGKFGEAVEKLVKWNRIQQIDTYGISQFENAYKKGIYPGLGVVKKYSIMHHLELMSRFLMEEGADNNM